MSTLSVLDTFLAPAKYKDADFAHLSARQLQALHSCFPNYPVADESVEALRRKFIDGRKKETIDQFKTYILGLKQRKQKGLVLKAAQIEEGAYSKGSVVVYSPKNVSISSRNGEKQVIPNSVVPDPNMKVRPYAGSLIAFLGRTLEVSQGGLAVKLDQNHAFTTAFNTPRASISVAGITDFGSMAKKLIVRDPLWINLTTHDKDQLTGSNLIDFFSRFVNTCPWDVYFALHTTIVTKALRVFSSFSKDSKGNVKIGAIVKFEKKPIIEKSSYSLGKGAVPEDWKLVGEQLAGANSCIQYMGVVALYYGGAKMFQNSVTMTNPRMADVRKAIQDGDSLRGGNGSATAILSSCVGFSGCPTNFTRSLQLFTSLAFYAIRKYKEVDIHLPTTGYLDYLISSIQDCRIALFGTAILSPDLTANIKFVLEYDKMPNDARRIWCSTKSRDKVFQVFRSSRNDTNFSEKTADDVVEETAAAALQRMTAYPLFAAICEVFGDKAWKSNYHVYRYGKEGDFLGIISTDPELGLFGTNEKKDSYEAIVLKKIANRTEYYEDIVRENLFRNAYFLVASSHYSPISNITSLSNNAVNTAAGDYHDSVAVSDNTEGWVNTPAEPEDVDEVVRGAEGSDESDSDADNGDYDDNPPLPPQRGRHDRRRNDDDNEDDDGSDQSEEEEDPEPEEDSPSPPPRRRRYPGSRSRSSKHPRYDSAEDDDDEDEEARYMKRSTRIPQKRAPLAKGKRGQGPIKKATKPPRVVSSTGQVTAPVEEAGEPTQFDDPNNGIY